MIVGTKRCYAADAALITENDAIYSDCYISLIIFKAFIRKISPHKTRSQEISTEPIKSKHKIEKRMVEYVMKFKYLGINLSSDNNVEGKSTSRIS